LAIFGISFIYLLNNLFSYYWIYFKINIPGGKKMFGHFSEITEPERSIYQNDSIKKKEPTNPVTSYWIKRRRHEYKIYSNC
jgi:hypothetical protein